MDQVAWSCQQVAGEILRQFNHVLVLNLLLIGFIIKIFSQKPIYTILSFDTLMLQTDTQKQVNCCTVYRYKSALHERWSKYLYLFLKRTDRCIKMIEIMVCAWAVSVCFCLWNKVLSLSSTAYDEIMSYNRKIMWNIQYLFPRISRHAVMKGLRIYPTYIDMHKALRHGHAAICGVNCKIILIKNDELVSYIVACRYKWGSNSTELPCYYRSVCFYI